ncbi:thiamine phosphate synthase [Arenibaculum pallidiluteum]|uniref:thiamine phosphate synthase n=1 Tax=Arenibaculum pallidiluteum TaxID=2812559 RepID=UPI001A97B74E|nr:thiamine phosphate synthase [Arenibaculum pallidiluteum]
MADCRLYLITPPAFEPAAFSEDLRRALGAGDVACLQLRLKDVPDDAIRRATEILMPIAQASDVAFLMNDRPDLARELGCDGVHVGQDDTPYRDARRIVGPDAIVGVSCQGSRHLAMVAAEDGADYVAFGPMFPTSTKPDAGDVAEIELLAWWAELFEVPCVAIGGITPANCAPLVRSGADFLCAISAVWNHPRGPDAAVREFNAAISAAS